MWEPTRLNSARPIVDAIQHRGSARSGLSTEPTQWPHEFAALICANWILLVLTFRGILYNTFSIERPDRCPNQKGMNRMICIVVANAASDRSSFVGGSDARVIMGKDEAALLRLWREKRGELEPEDLSGDLVVQLGSVTEALNRQWYEKNTGQIITDVQRRVSHKVHRWMAATLDGKVAETGAVFEAKFMLPWSFSEEAAAEKHMAQLQHNMWVTASRTAVLSIITGGGKWVEMTISADPLYQHLRFSQQNQKVLALRRNWR